MSALLRETGVPIALFMPISLEHFQVPFYYGRHMAQSLQLSQKMALSQVLAPQLQQSLALLQAPTLELKAMVAQELEQNPMLEELEITEMTQEEKESRETEDTAAAAPADPAEPPADVAFDPATEKDS